MEAKAQGGLGDGRNWTRVGRVTFCLRMTFSEKRFPLFVAMR